MKNSKVLKIITLIFGIINACLLITSIVKKNINFFYIALALTFIYNAIIVTYKELKKTKNKK